jgi:cysteine desulfurase family protein (TIGR01976 family)
MSRMPLSIDEIRAQFPALQRMHANQPVAYFDAPGGTQVPRVVAEAMTSYLFEHNANTHWAYPSSAETDAILYASREAAADFLHCSPHEIVFGNNMTTIAFHLGRTLGRTWSAGDEIVVTELDHHANQDPWRALERERGVVVRAARMLTERAQVDYDHLASLLNARTKLVAIGGASNAVGTVNDLERAAQLAHSAGALLFVDAVHLAPHELVDVARIGCDFLACSSYKFYGPHAGILFARRELLETLPFPKLTPSPDDAPDRAETGTQNHEAIAGIGATIEFLASIGGDADGGATRRERLTRAYAFLHDAGLRLTRKLWDGLRAIPGVTLYGPLPDQPRTPTVAFTVDGVDAESVCRALAADAVFASHGDFYAETAIQRLGVEALVRVGCACYTTEEEVARLLAATERVARAARARAR